MMATEVSELEREAEYILALHGEFRRAGWDENDAQRLAVANVRLQDATALVAKGCDKHTATEILA